MARGCIREPRHIRPTAIIGTQADLFGGPIITHEVRQKPFPKGGNQQLRAYHLADHFADLENDQ